MRLYSSLLTIMTAPAARSFSVSSFRSSFIAGRLSTRYMSSSSDETIVSICRDKIKAALETDQVSVKGMNSTCIQK